eukprot:PhF_6_TR37080/c0_g1_i3/m.54348
MHLHHVKIQRAQLIEQLTEAAKRHEEQQEALQAEVIRQGESATVAVEDRKKRYDELKQDRLGLQQKGDVLAEEVERLIGLYEGLVSQRNSLRVAIEDKRRV